MITKILRNIAPFTLILVLGISSLEARSFRVNQLPNGSSVGCGGCHVNSGGGGTRNAFGSLVQSSFLVNSNVNWVADLATVDSDGDGFSNGHELEDPFGMWTLGTANPGNMLYVTNPGVASSVPTGDAAKFSLHMAISQMSAHSGQYFELRLVETSSGTVLATEELASIVEADFEYVFMHALDADASYHVDLWADFNGNGSYDAPPMDHSWRIELNGVSDNLSQSFQHNTDFTDIGDAVSVDTEIDIPREFVLYENYPNPFNPTTQIRFDLATSGYVNLDIFNIRGEQVGQLLSEDLIAGSYNVQWLARDMDGNVLPSGIYIYTLRSSGLSQSKRMMMLK